jgi:mannitol/fructose-specific phosphotransferase system IIA component (Ntr-type)
MMMRISEGLECGAVVVRQSWHSFEATISGLIEELVGAGRIRGDLQVPAVRHICQREAIASTAMVDIGVSIPHARIEGIDSILIALAVAPDAVYEVTAGAPISIVALVLSSPSLTGEHLNYLSSLSMLLQSEHNRQRLRSAASPAEVVQLVRENEQLRG